MILSAIVFALMLSPKPAALEPGDHTRTLEVARQTRSYLVHIPRQYDLKKPTPVVLALHGATMDAAQMVDFSDLNAKSDREGFIVVYPNGTGPGPLLLTWNASGPRGWMGNKTDDVQFIGKVLDELATVVTVDRQRVYACGISNGAMMCYLLASQMSDRIAAIASVSGTVAADDNKPGRPVPVLHFHGTKDPLVPFDGPTLFHGAVSKFKSVDDTIQTWTKLDRCPEKAKSTEELSKAGDELRVTRTTYGPGKNGSEVVLVVIEGGGHTWPGRKAPLEWLGKSALNISANDLIWEFFQKHPMKD